MSIQPFAAGSFSADRTTANLVGLKSRLDGLATQLANGRAATTYGGLGGSRTTSLSGHATISALDGYTAAIDGASTRVALTSKSLTQIKTLADSTRTGLVTSLQSKTPIGISTSVALARTNFDAAVDALNQQVAGQYFFSGRATDTEPVVSSDLIFNGDPGKGIAGLKDLIAEQKAADLGPGGNGRLTQARSGTSVTLSEDGSFEARANFGFSLLGVASSNPAGVTASLNTVATQGGEPGFDSVPTDGARVRVAVLLDDGSQKVIDLTARKKAADDSTASFEIGATPADSASNLKAALQTILGSAPKIASIQSADPPGASLTFPADSPGSALSLDVQAPAAGDTVTLTLGLRDGTTTTITLKASADTTSATAFKIDTTGASAADRAANTAANLNEALTKALASAANTDLSASSTARAAQNLFDGSSSAGLAPRRVDGNGYAETASTTTVIWYKGDDVSPDPRGTASVQVGANRSVAIGAQANEAPIRATLADLAALAAGGFTDAAGVQDTARFAAAASRTQLLLRADTGNDDLTGITSEFSIASSSMANAKTQAQATKATLQDSLEGIETVSTEEVAAKLLNLQTQLQASYQVASMLSKLTLVNYIS